MSAFFLMYVQSSRDQIVQRTMTGFNFSHQGMCLLTTSVSVPSLKPPPCDGAKCEPASALQVGAFFGALYILAIGTGGTRPNISTIGADQFDDFDPRERAHKISFFNWWLFAVFSGTLFANIIIVYLQDNVSWSIGYGIPTAGLFISVLIFLAGTPFYRHKVPRGSPLTRMARVLVAAIRKRRVPLPDNAMELHELDSEESAKKRKSRILSADSLRSVVRTVILNLASPLLKEGVFLAFFFFFSRYLCVAFVARRRYI